MRSFAWLSVVAIVAASSPVLAAAKPPTTGTWVGEMRQIDPDRETSYPMTLTLMSKGKKGKVAYPTLKCAGTLSKIADVKAGYTVYYETVTNEPGGTCIDGVVTVSHEAGKIVLGWFATFGGGPSLASAVLEKTAK